MAINFGLGPHLRVMNPIELGQCLPVTDSQTRIFKNILKRNNGQNYDEYGVYHLWLECLYKINLQFSDIINGLDGLLTTEARRKLIDYDKIFILGHKCKDGSMKPAGSCIILLSKLIIDNCNFKAQILEKRVKMIRVSYQVLRELLSHNYIFMFKEAEGKSYQLPPITTTQTPVLMLSQTRVETSLNKTYASVTQSEQKVCETQSRNKSTDLMSKLTKLDKIQHREIAERLLTKYKDADVTYIKFFVRGTTDIKPSLFSLAFKSNIIEMSNVYLINVESYLKLNSVSGFSLVNVHPDVFLEINHNSRINIQKITNEVEIEIKIIDYHTFKSMLLKFSVNHKFENFNNNRDDQEQVEQSKKKKKTRRGRRRRKLTACTNMEPEVVINKQLPNDPIELESILNNELDNEDKLNEFVSNTVTKLLLNGNIILRVLNLPATLTIYQLNLLMGTYTLFEKQLVAVKRARNNPPDLMDLMIVIRGDNLDKERILDKDHSKTQNDSILICKVSTILELERFLKRNYNNLHKFEIQETLPTN